MSLAGSSEAGEFLQRDTRLSQPGRIDPGSLCHQRPALHIIFGGVDAIEGNDAAFLKVDYREASRADIAPDHRRIEANRETDGLQPKVILI